VFNTDISSCSIATARRYLHPLQDLPIAPCLNDALKLSRDTTLTSFVVTQRALRKIGLTEIDGLNAAEFHNDV